MLQTGTNERPGDHTRSARFFLLAWLTSAACGEKEPGADADADTDADADNDGDGYAAAEDCDGVDGNCSGDESDAAALPWYADADADGYGDASSPLLSCEQPAGYTADSADCLDSDAATYPGAPVTCSGGRSEGCDTLTAEACATDLSAAYAALRRGGSDDLGGAAAIAGDVNGDGLADVIVGDSGYDGTFGAAFLVLGPVSGELDLADSADARLLGDAEYTSAGDAVAGAGDVDGDGLDDLLVGAPGDDSGAVYLLDL